VAKSKADLALKRLTLERSRQLLAERLISQSELDAASSNHDQAVAQLALDRASVDQAQAALEEARINLAYTDIVSPVDGVVVSRNVDVGQTVAASFQTPTLFEIAQDLTEMQVNANVSESDIGTVHPGQGVAFGVDAYPGRVFEGTVVQVRNAPIVLQNVVTYDVVVKVDNSSLELKPGMTATVTITTDRRDDAIRIPVRALRFRPEAPGDGGSTAPAAATREAGEPAPTVWLAVPGGGLRPVEIKTGLRNDRHVELLSEGLAPGDAVAVAYQRAAASEPAARSPFAPGRPR
jgi:HlyD family secretion protein